MPDGWKDFEQAAGRATIGVGQGAGLSERALGQRGGAEAHLLTVDELPAHNHAIWGQDSVFQLGGNASTSVVNKDKPFTFPGGKGGDKPHNIMPPWVALRYCEKN